MKYYVYYCGSQILNYHKRDLYHIFIQEFKCYKEFGKAYEWNWLFFYSIYSTKNRDYLLYQKR